MRSLEREPEAIYCPPRVSGHPFAMIFVMASVSQLVSGCVVPSVSRNPEQVSAGNSPDLSPPSIVIRENHRDSPPSDRECREYHHWRIMECQRQIRVLTLELELYRDELTRLEREGADQERIDQVRHEVFWRIGAMGLLLGDPSSDRSDIAGF